jgi:hypothetical protein
VEPGRRLGCLLNTCIIALYAAAVVVLFWLTIQLLYSKAAVLKQSEAQERRSQLVEDGHSADDQYQNLEQIG